MIVWNTTHIQASRSTRWNTEQSPIGALPVQPIPPGVCLINSWGNVIHLLPVQHWSLNEVDQSLTCTPAVHVLLWIHTFVASTVHLWGPNMYCCPLDQLDPSQEQQQGHWHGHKYVRKDNPSRTLWYASSVARPWRCGFAENPIQGTKKKEVNPWGSYGVQYQKRSWYMKFTRGGWELNTSQADVEDEFEFEFVYINLIHTREKWGC